MTLKILVPDILGPFIEDLEQLDLQGFIQHSKYTGNRSLIFFEESVVGFIIHTGKTEQPLSVLLSVASKQDDEYNIPEEAEQSKYNQIFDAFNKFLDSPVLSGTCIVDGEEEFVAVWKFEVPVRFPKRRLGGPLTFNASVSKPHLHVQPTATEEVDCVASTTTGSPMLTENLFEELNHRLVESVIPKYEFSRDHMGIVPESSTSTVDLESDIVTHPEISSSLEKATLTIATSLPLLLKLKSTKPGGRNQMLLSSLSIEASEELAASAEQAGQVNYHLNILSLEASFKAGKMEELSPLRFPCRCSMFDIVNVTYRLENNDYVDSQMKNTTDFVAAVSKPLHLQLKMKVQKLNETTGEFEDVSNVISTSWSPLLDFGLVAPPISNSLKSSANLSHFQIQSQFQPAIPKSAQNGNATRKSAMLNSASNASRSKASFAGVRSRSPGPRTHLASALTPLPSPKSILSKKTHKSMVALPTSSSAVTVNLTSGNNSTLAGLKLTFEGCLSVELGKIINWKVQAINNSDKTLNLSLIVKNPINFNPVYLPNNPSGTLASNASSSNMLTTKEMNDNVLVYSRLLLYYQYNHLKLETGGVIVLTNDIRLGPIEPNSVFESEFEIIGISKGIFNLNGLKIFDFVSGDGIDFGKLVEVFVM